MRNYVQPASLIAACGAALLLSLFLDSASAFVPNNAPLRSITTCVPHPPSASCSASSRLHADATSTDDAAAGPSTPAPQFNGKTILPYRVLSAGLTDEHQVAAVYAVLSSSYKKKSGTDGWEHCSHVGVTRDLGSALKTHVAARGKAEVAHVRALSFSFPQRSVMEELAGQWREKTVEAGGTAGSMEWAKDLDQQKKEELIRIMEETAVFEDDDDDEDDYYDDDEEDAPLFADPTDPSDASAAAAPAETADGETVSPFAVEAKIEGSSDQPLEFNKETVDKVLDEVRPYLISDGGNVAVESVDVEKQNVYLILEGACGSCPSSTVTMQMGIERVLRENFPNLESVEQVEDPATAGEAKPTELTLEAVQAELNRIKPAVQAMGGSVDIVSVDPLGVVKLNYRGSNKVKQGLELALRDVEYVKHVDFVSQ